MSITSSSFPAGGAIPLKYTCDAGPGSPNPALAFAGAPAAAQSLVLSWTTPTCPRRWYRRASSCTGWSGTWRRIPRASPRARARAASTAWAGPATWALPDRPRASLFFKLYALDTKITTPLKTKTDLMKAMEGHVLEQAELMATYERVKK